MQRLGWVFLLGLLIAPTARATEEPGETRRPYFFTGVGRTLKILGSADVRDVRGFGIHVVFGPERRGKTSGYWTATVYSMRHAPTSEGFPGPTVSAIGILGGYQWERRARSGHGFYAGVSWGLQFSTSATHDLDSKLNSTPSLSAGFFFPAFGTELAAGIYFLHTSNAGTVGRNIGQNAPILSLGIRF